MQIDFFEEFPTKENLQKLELIDWPCLVYLAAHSLKEFEKIEKKARTINPKLSYGYWPVLKVWEGYWLHPFSRKAALIRIINELKQNKKLLELLWDYEAPLLNPLLFIFQLFNYKKNKKLIYGFIESAHRYKIKVAIAENKPALPDSFGDKRIIMAYSSDFSVAPKKALVKKIALGNKFKQRLEIGLGCISYGILRIEPRLSPRGLDRDLGIVKKAGINKIVIFRLSGLNESYLKVLKKYL